MVAGSAEQTRLPDRSADFVTAGQAFHWFQPARTRREFARIVKPEGWVVLIWHDRDTESGEFLKEYESLLLRHSTDYPAIAHNKVANYRALERFFSPNAMHLVTQASSQRFDLEGLRGRLLSSSYVPREGPGAEAMLKELPALFHRFAQNGEVVLAYQTKIYFGHLAA
jgi:SAM-dependent methyltransferase